MKLYFMNKFFEQGIFCIQKLFNIEIKFFKSTGFLYKKIVRVGLMNILKVLYKNFIQYFDNFL